MVTGGGFYKISYSVTGICQKRWLPKGGHLSGGFSNYRNYRKLSQLGVIP